MRQLILELAPTPAATLDNFVVGRNAELVHSLRSAATGEATAIFVWGEPGSGRTHLMQGFVSAVRERSATAQYVACTPELRLHRDLHGLDGVAIDDVERLAPEEQVGLFNLYNDFKERSAACVVSGSAPPRTLGLRHDIETRLAWGLVYQVHALSDEEKIDSLRDHAAARGIRLPDEVLAYLLGRVRRDMGTLLAVLDALDRSSLAAKRAITVPFVRDWLQARDQGVRVRDRGFEGEDRGLSERLVLFDLDNTLLAGDSDFEWAQFLIEQGVLDREAYEARNQDFYDQYRAGTLDIHEFLNFQLKPLSRHPRPLLDEWHRQFMAARMLPLIRASARALVAKHRNDVRVIITATNSFVTAPIAREFGIEHLIATEPETRGGDFTGNVTGTPCFKEGKVSRLEAWLDRRGETLASFAASWFYSDSFNDLPLLQRVTHPVAVDPDERLRAHAHARAWPIISLNDAYAMRP